MISSRMSRLETEVSDSTLLMEMRLLQMRLSYSGAEATELTELADWF